MTTSNRSNAYAASDTPLRFVAVLDSKGQSKQSLEAILPDLAEGNYHTHFTGRVALAADTASKAVSVTRIGQRLVILLGNMVSELVEPDAALEWSVRAVAEGRYAELKTLQGVFALIVVDSAGETVTVVSDLVGIQPFYVAKRGKMTILSDRAEAAPRLGGASIDTLGMAGWLYFGTPLANRTMFESVERIAPASVTIFEAQSSRQETFWHPSVADEAISAAEHADGVYHEFTASLRRLARPHKAGTVLLSGGFDSRLCLLTSLRETDISVDALTVPYTRAEQSLVNELVRMTGIECHQVKIKKSIWDEFDSMWYRHPDGFLRWRNLCYLCATRLGKSRLFIDGSHSDSVLRSTRSRPTDGRTFSEREAREYVWKIHVHRRVEGYFRSDLAARFEQLARQAADEQSDAIGWSAKFCRLWDIQTDERRNIAFNHLQYAHLAGSIQPFYDRALMERCLRYRNEMFTHESYHSMLSQYFPGPGELPHSDDLPKEKDTQYAFSRSLWKELPMIMRFIHRHRDVLKRRRLAPRVGGYALGRRRHMHAVLELMRYVKLEEEMNSLGIELDFRKALN